MVSAGTVALRVFAMLLLIGLALTVGQRVVDAMLRRARRDGENISGGVTVAVLVAFGLAVATQWVGVEGVLGAFIAGVLLGRSRFQQEAVLTYVGETDVPRAVALLQGFWMALYGGFELHSGNAALDDLLSRGGMASMLLTVWLIMSAMMFGGVMETTGMLRKIGQTILGFVTGTGSLIAATLLTAIGFNIIASDQYMAIVLPGRMFRAEYQKRRLDPKNLSRTLEDAGTLTSVLVPWNTCGAFIAQTLGVATLTYAPYCFFNLLNPMIAALYGFTNFTIDKLPESYSEDESVVA